MGTYDLETHDRCGWKGIIKIQKINIITGKTTEKTRLNRIMNNALDEIVKSLYLLANSNIYLNHVAIGDDNTANSDSLEKLYNEIYRTPVISRLKTGTGKIETRGTLLAEEPESMSGIVTIREIGFFAGSHSLNWDDGVGKDTGLMVARIVVNESKTASEQINITRIDEYVRES